MADCLGLRLGVDYEPRRYVLSDKPSLGSAVFWGMRDPVANARAQRRLAVLRAELPIPYPDGAPPGYYGPVHAERFDSGHVLLS